MRRRGKKKQAAAMSFSSEQRYFRIRKEKTVKFPVLMKQSVNSLNNSELLNCYEMNGSLGEEKGRCGRGSARRWIFDEKRAIFALFLCVKWDFSVYRLCKVLNCRVYSCHVAFALSSIFNSNALSFQTEMLWLVRKFLYHHNSLDARS